MNDLSSYQSEEMSIIVYRNPVSENRITMSVAIKLPYGNFNTYNNKYVMIRRWLLEKDISVPAERAQSLAAAATAHLNAALAELRRYVYIYFYKEIISSTLYPTYGRVGRRNLVLRHSVPHFPPNVKCEIP